MDLVEGGRVPRSDGSNGQPHVDFYHGAFVIGTRGARIRRPLRSELPRFCYIVLSIGGSIRLPKTYQHATSAEMDSHLCLDLARFGNVLVSKSFHEPHIGKVCPWYVFIVRPSRSRHFVSQHERHSFFIVYSHDKKPNCTKAANDYEHLTRFFDWCAPHENEDVLCTRAFSAQRTPLFRTLESSVFSSEMMASNSSLRVLCSLNHPARGIHTCKRSTASPKISTVLRENRGSVESFNSC